MALKFFNIRNKEIRVADTEPMIAGLWSSSDRGPNVQQGQDFGWRLAPEVVVELKRIRQDYQKLMEIAQRYAKPVEDVNEPDILRYISDRTSWEDAPVAQEGDYSDEYAAEIRRLEQQPDPTTPETATTSATTENLTTTTTTIKVK